MLLYLNPIGVLIELAILLIFWALILIWGYFLFMYIRDGKAPWPFSLRYSHTPEIRVHARDGSVVDIDVAGTDKIVNVYMDEHAHVRVIVRGDTVAAPSTDASCMNIDVDTFCMDILYLCFAT